MKHPLALLVLAGILTSMPADAADIDWKKVDVAIGKTAIVSGDVHRYGLPRSDLKVTLEGGWITFAPMHGEAMVMGDLVLLEPKSRRS